MAKMLSGGILRNLSKANLNFVSRHLFGRGKIEPRYNVRLAFPCDYDRVMHFMSETYLKSEPSIVNIGGGLAETGSPLLIHSMYLHIREGLTLIAEDLDGCVAGAAVNVNARREYLEHGDRLAACCERGPAVELFKFFTFCSRQSDLWAKYGVNPIFECAHVSVHPEHQGKGIAKRLIMESWVLARDMAYRLFRIDCSNRYTARIAEKLGWQCVFSIPYRRYFDNGNFVFTCVREPHTEMKIYVDPLNYYGGFFPPSCKSK